MNKKYFVLILVVAVTLCLGGCFGGDDEPPVVIVSDGGSSEPTTTTTTTTSSVEPTENTTDDAEGTTTTVTTTRADVQDFGDESGFYEAGVLYQFAKPGGEKLVSGNTKVELEEIGVKVELRGYASNSQLEGSPNSLGVAIEKDGKPWAIVYSEGMYVYSLGNVGYRYPEQTDNYVYITHRKSADRPDEEWKMWAIPLREERARAVFLGDLTDLYDFSSIYPAGYMVDMEHGYYQKLIARHMPKGGDAESEEVCMIVYSDFVKGASEFAVLKKDVPKAEDGSGYLDFDISGKKEVVLIGEPDESDDITTTSTADTTDAVIGADYGAAAGFYRLWGEEGTAGAEISADGGYTAYYASGAQEFAGRIEHSEGYRYVLYVEETGGVYSIEFDSSWQSFVMGDLEFKRVNE